MGKVFDSLEGELAEFIAAQHLFFVATAPLSSDGSINVSPKGYDSLRVLGPRTLAYLDLTGSGVETIAHLRENGRITLMWCAFEGRPRIVRVYGRGEVLLPGSADFDALRGRFVPHDGTRSIIRITAERIADACGYTVPRFSLVGGRDQLDKWVDNKGPAGLEAYRRDRNAVSIDGLPGLAPEE